MTLTHRPMTEADMPECLRIARQGRNWGYTDAQPANVLALWRAALCDEASVSGVVENTDRPVGARVLAFGLSLFVTDAFFTDFQSEGAPHLPERVLQRWRVGQPPWLTRAALRRANSGDGLNTMILDAGYAEEVNAAKSGVEYHAVSRMLMAAFFEAHRGYRVKELLAERYGDVHHDIYLGGGFERRTDYAAFYARQGRTPPPASERPCLFGLTRAEAFASPGRAIAMLFLYTPPRFFFRDSEQELLRLALGGETDEELARSLSVSLWAVKKRWQTAYRRVAEAAPDLLPGTDAALPEQKRGTEKRRRLLEHLRRHPEELRPVTPPRPAGTAAPDAPPRRASERP